MIQRPTDIGRFQFVVLSSLRVAQLIRGCRPLVEGVHKKTTVAQIEVSERKITQVFPSTDPLAVPAIVEV